MNLSGFYFCPHHPEKGFQGEIRELKVDCNCRKPNIGMCKKICEDFNIDLENSIVIGDSFRDQEMARNFGIKFLNVQDI